MQTQAGFRFRCYPTPEQAQTLLHWIGCQRFIYNVKVSEDRYFRKFARTALGLPEKYPPIDSQYSHFIDPELTPWLREVPCQVLRNGTTKWRQSYARYFKRISGRPVIKKKTGKQSVWITSELFNFTPMINTQTGEILGNKLTLGTKKFPVGDILFNPSREYRIPKSIHISIENGRWYLSFSNEDSNLVSDESDTIEWLRQFTEEELLTITFGGDRGIEIPLAGNNGEIFDFSDIQKERIAKKIIQTKRYQRKMARQRLQALKEKRSTGSNYLKTKNRLTRSYIYGRDVREDFAHKTSHAIINDSDKLLYVFEDLNVKGMTKKPKAKKDTNGKWARNKASAKAGLSKKNTQFVMG